ncbi:MAG: hypothetical protein HYU28_05445 [Actinobacteria bacterium]|nr:hypothetical protein [Actinomycetota bacterium]
MIGVVGLACDAGDPVQSQTPRITAAEPGRRDETVLLTEDDVARLEGFEGARATEIDDVPIFENPDPRGPCGGVAPDLQFPGAIGRAFTSEKLVVFEFVAPRSAAHDEALAAFQSDARPGCRSYDSLTNTGDRQLVSEITLLDLSDLGVPSVGWTSTIKVRNEESVGGLIAAAVGTRFLVVQVNGLELPPPKSLRELARRAVKRVEGVT